VARVDAFRLVVALSVVFSAVVGLAACNQGIPGNAVVEVGETPITKATYNHWLTIAASATAGATGAKPVAPDPPAYRLCIAQLEATAPKPAKGEHKSTAAQLRTECEQEYRSLRQQVLGFLISSEWVLSEAESRGVTVSDQEVTRQFEVIKRAQFPKGAAFKQYLSSSGSTVADLLWRVKVNLLSSKTQEMVSRRKAVSQAEVEQYYSEHKARFGRQTLLQSASSIKRQLTVVQQQAALNKFAGEFKSKWTAKTVCRAGYVVSDCADYKP
jgi:foldase protein PrsA